MAKRTAVKQKHKRPAGISKEAANAVHDLHTGRGAGAKGQAKKSAPASAPADVTPRQPHGKRYTFTTEIDNALRAEFTKSPRTAAKTVSFRFGFPFHVVKNRIKALRLDAEVPTKTPKARRRKTPAESPATEPSAPTATTQPADTATEATPARIRHAICPNRPQCYTRAQFDPNDTPEQLREQGFIYGLDPETKFPICANCRTTMVAAEPVAAPEAIEQAIAAGNSRQPRLWPDPPFNADGALRELFEKRREARILKEASEVKQREAKKAQKAYAKCLVEKDAMEEAFETRMLEKQREALNRIDRAEERILEQSVRDTSACAFEKNTGKPCPVCRAESPSLVAAALQSTNGALSDVATDAHRTLALKANSRSIGLAEKIRDNGLVVDALTARGLLGITEEVVETWDEVQRREALAWVDAGMHFDDLPAVLGRPHIAAAAGTDEQSCLECGARLLNLKAGDDGEVQPYPLGAIVGMHCSGAEASAPAPADAPSTTAQA